VQAEDSAEHERPWVRHVRVDDISVRESSQLRDRAHAGATLSV
jgi:hypothetical protein